MSPTAAGLVSRAWVIDEVESRNVDVQRRAALIDELVGYEPPRRHGLRNSFIFWIGVFGASMLATAIGIPGWVGFVIALLFFIWVARELAVRALRWRLDQMLDAPPPPD
ncbi:MAG: hypothetical protein ACRECQ_01960 [Burkholderiaceae bacterium]